MEIFYVSKMAIQNQKCPSVMSRRDTFNQHIKIDFCQETLDPWMKYKQFSMC